MRRAVMDCLALVSRCSLVGIVGLIRAKLDLDLLLPLLLGFLCIAVLVLEGIGVEWWIPSLPNAIARPSVLLQLTEGKLKGLDATLRGLSSARSIRRRSLGLPPENNGEIEANVPIDSAE